MTILDDAFETIRKAHDDSSANLLADRAAAGDDLALVRRINRNHQMLTIQLLDAASAILDANNEGVAAALAAAQAANEDVAKRRKKAAKIVKIVESVADAVDAAGGLLKVLRD